jgi:hypothetical protein
VSSSVPGTPAGRDGQGGQDGQHGKAQAPAWYDGIADEPLRRWAQAKGWKDPLAAVESNYNLERMVGAERAGRMVALPGENATPEELRAFHSRIGVPESAEGYRIPLPEGAPSDFARTAAQWLHEAGVPAQSATLLAQRWNDHLAQSQAAAAQQRVAAEQARAGQSQAQVGELKAEWGNAFDANTDFARRAALHFLPAADEAERTALMNTVEKALGSGPFLRFMSRIGRGLSEHLLVGSGDAGGYGTYAPAEARARIAHLRADRAWTASYIAGDAAKAAEMNRLHRMAFPGEA